MDPSSNTKKRNRPLRNQYSSMLRARSRGDQHLRRDILRPPVSDPNIRKRAKVYELIQRAETEERAKHLKDAKELSERALRLARELPNAEKTSLISQIEVRVKTLNCKIRQKEKRLFRPFLNLPEASAAS
jgi:hypothetical protein